MKFIKALAVKLKAGLVAIGGWLCPDIDDDDFWNGCS